MELIHFPALFWLAWLLLVVIGVIRVIVVPHRRKQIGFAVAFVVILPFAVSVVLCMSLDKKQVLQILAEGNIIPKDNISISGRYRTDKRGWIRELTEPKGGNWSFDVHLSGDDMQAVVAQFHPEEYHGMVICATANGLKPGDKYITDFQQDGTSVRWLFFYDKMDQLRSCRMVIDPYYNTIVIDYAADPPLEKWLMF